MLLYVDIVRTVIFFFFFGFNIQSSRTALLKRPTTNAHISCFVERNASYIITSAGSRKRGTLRRNALWVLVSMCLNHQGYDLQKLPALSAGLLLETSHRFNLGCSVCTPIHLASFSLAVLLTCKVFLAIDMSS